MKLENVIYCGDNLIWLKQFPEKCIDLIYLDPPFFSNRHYEVIFNDLKSLEPFEFQNWCVGALGGTINPKKVGDMGIDGFTFFNRYPIQVKQSENVGRNVVDNFETAIQRIEKDRGYIIAFSFGKGAYEETARIKSKGIFIELLKVDKLLEYTEEKVSDKMFEFY